MEKKKVSILILMICMCFSVAASAETIVLKSGKTVEGKILEKTDKYIKIDFEGVSLTYSIDEVERIYEKPVNISNEFAASTAEDILKKADYYHSISDFDKSIELCELASKKTDDKNLIAKINLTLSSNYLEKGKEAYEINKDDSFYKLSIQFAKKSLEANPYDCLALFNIGLAYFGMQDWKQAIFYFSEVENFLDRSNPANAEIIAAIDTSRSIAEKNMRAQQ